MVNNQNLIAPASKKVVLNAEETDPSFPIRRVFYIKPSNMNTTVDQKGLNRMIRNEHFKRVNSYT